MTRPSAAAPVSADQIAELLARWQSSGLVTAEQAQRIAAAESFAPASGPPRLRPPGGAMVGEALGYAGAVLIVAAVMVLMGRFWFDLNLGVRVIITGGAAAETWLLGRLATARFGRPGRRLCGVLCTVSVGMFGATAALVAADGLHWADNNVAVFAGALAAGYAIGLWRRAESVPLHAATFAAVAVSIGAAADHLEALHDQAAPLGIWLLAISWLWAARAGTIAPRQFGCLLGAVVAIVAAQSTQQVRWGLALAVVTAAALVALAVRERNLPLLGVGAFGTFLSVPPVMQRMFPGSVGAAVGLLIAGALMLLCAIAVLRRDPVLGGMTWSGELDAAFGDPTTDSNRARRFPIGRLPATTTGPPSPGEALRLENRRQTHDISNLANASSGHNAHAGVAAVDLWSERLAQPANAPHTAGDVTEATSACSCRFTRTRRADPTGGGPIPVAVGDALVLESIEYRAPG